MPENSEVHLKINESPGFKFILEVVLCGCGLGATLFLVFLILFVSFMADFGVFKIDPFICFFGVSKSVIKEWS
jgi:hypothetical protein